METAEKLEFVVDNVPVDLRILCSQVTKQFRENGFPGLIVTAEETSDSKIRVSCISSAVLSKHGNLDKSTYCYRYKNEFTSEKQIKDFIVETCLQYIHMELYFLTTLIDKILEVQDRTNWSEEMLEVYYDWFLPVKYTQLYKQFT